MSSEAASRARLIGWKALNQLSNTPLGKPLRSFLKRSGARSTWHAFRPSATSLERLSLLFDADHPEACIDEAEAILRRHGVVILHGAVDGAAAERAGNELARFLHPFIAAQALGEAGGELGGCTWQNDLQLVPDFLRHPAPVINFHAERPGAVDVGTIGVSKAESLAQDHGLTSVAAVLGSPAHRVAEKIIARLFSSTRRYHQLYESRGVTSPRPVHTDTLGEYYNLFTYLSDVERETDGPYRYVPGSHLRRDLLTKGVVLARLQGGVVKNFPELGDAAVPMLGPKGSIIISNQRGVHGAHPQAPDGYRAMLTVNFT